MGRPLVEIPTFCLSCGADLGLYTYKGYRPKTCGKRECLRASQAKSNRARLLAQIAARGGMCRKGLHPLTVENAMPNEHGMRCRPCHKAAADERRERVYGPSWLAKEAAKPEEERHVPAFAEPPVVTLEPVKYVPLYVQARLSEQDVDTIMYRYEPGSSGPNGSVALAAEYNISRADLWEYIRVRQQAEKPQPERKRYRNYSLSGVMA